MSSFTTEPEQRFPLDSFGNSMAKNTGYAKPAFVPIKRLVYKDDE
jgi:hypothetical protein